MIIKHIETISYISILIEYNRESMDFRTEWSSWLLVVIMMILAYIISPFEGNTYMQIAQAIGFPLAAIAIACIPVLIFCYFIKVIPDIDYSIRLAFVFVLIKAITYFM